MREYKLHGKPIMKYQSRTCFWCWCWKNLFFNVKLKLMKIFKFFSVSLNTLSGSSHSQIFFKIGVIKNFATLRIKKRLERRCFPVRSSNMLMLTYWYISFQKCWESDFHAIVLYLFLKNWPIPQHISVCSVKINFSNCNRWN